MNFKIKLRKTERQKTVRELDKLYSELVRKRAMKLVGGCQRCKAPKRSWKELDCAHFHSRRKYSVRWHELNACGLCGGCHRHIDDNAYEKVEFFRELLNGEFDKLNIEAEILSSYSTNDYKLIEIYLKQKIEELLKQETGALIE